MADDPVLDPDQAARALGRANRKPWFIGLGVVAAIAIAGLVYVKMGESAVRRALVEKGFSDIKLESTGMLSWKYEATKGATKCFGTVSRSPGSISTQESCVTHEETKPVREQIESHFSDEYAHLGFDTFTCPDIDKQDAVTCTMSAKNGAKTTITATATERNDDGTWHAWHTHKPTFVTSVEELESHLGPAITAGVAKQFPKATVEFDCGSGAIAFDDHNKYACKLKMTNPDKSPTLDLSDGSDGMAWTIDGL